MCCFVRIVSGEIVLNKIGSQSLWCRSEINGIQTKDGVEKPRKELHQLTQEKALRKEEMMSRFQPRCNQRV
jgi:hypothetical protein